MHTSRGLFITATDTEVGKTHITGVLASLLSERMGEHGLDVWKPVQSGVSVGDVEADSRRLQEWSNLSGGEAARVTCTFPEPLAPWMAARRAGVTVDYDGLVDEGLRRIERAFTLVEGAGGLAVPITGRKLMSDLAKDLNVPILLVARAGLGTVNHTLLSVAFARQAGLGVAGVVLNGQRDLPDANVRENIEMIETFGGVEVLGVLPWLDPARTGQSEWKQVFLERIGLERLLAQASRETKSI